MLRKFYLILFTSLLRITASAYDFEVDGIFYNTISLQDLTCEVTYRDNNYNSYFGEIVIPSTVITNGKTLSVISIGEYAFSKCSGMTSLTIPESVTSIGNSAFYNCTALTTVEIPNSVSSFGNLVFDHCTNLISVTIPNSVTTIGFGTFEHCWSLESVTLPNTISSIVSAMFYNCISLTEVTIPSSATSIGGEAFRGCSSLKSLTIPNSITYIGYSAFSYCSGLVSITIPSSVTSLGDESFNKCTSLTSAVIGESVTSIGDYAFRDCSALKEITSLAITPPVISSSVFEGVSKTDAVVKVPDESLNEYQSASYWKAFWNIIGLNGVGGEDSSKKCSEPTIELENGKIVRELFTSLIFKA